MSKNQRKVAANKSAIIEALPRACSDETAAVEFLEAQRWGDTPACVHCGSVDDIYQMTSVHGGRSERFLWRCRGCDKQFSVRVGTVFEDSRIPLRFWCLAFWRMCASKKGISALQLSRESGLSYKSALFLCHRVRFAMADDHAEPKKISGVIEADETFCGGKPRRGVPRKKWSTKTPVMALIERNTGQVRANVVPTVTAANVERVLRENVNMEDSSLLTDESPSYITPGRAFKDGHSRVLHKAWEYARGSIHINTCESFFSLLKRRLNGAHHAVSKKHLHRYVSEQEFQWNNREVDDGERTRRAIKKADGKRLRYREPA